MSDRMEEARRNVDAAMGNVDELHKADARIKELEAKLDRVKKALEGPHEGGATENLDSYTLAWVIAKMEDQL